MSGFYFSLQHGSQLIDQPEADLSHIGPAFGPFSYCFIDHGRNIKLLRCGLTYDTDEARFSIRANGLLYYDGWYYSDFAWCPIPDGDITFLTPYDYGKSIWPLKPACRADTRPWQPTVWQPRRQLG